MKRILKIFLLCVLTATSSGASTNVAISPWYDNRKCPVLFGMDDWRTGNRSSFIEAIDICATYNVRATVAIITSDNTAASWSDAQSYLDAGKATYLSHSFTPINYQETWNTLAEAAQDVPDEVSKSITNLTENLNLPNWQKYNGSEYANAWAQPWGTAKLIDETDIQDWVDAVLSTNLFLASISDFDNKHVPPIWDGTVGNNGIYPSVSRVGYNTNSIYSDYDFHVAYFDSCYATGGVYHTYSHPETDPWDGTDYNGTLASNVVAYIGNRKNVWYAGSDEMIMYRYLRDVATPTISVTEGTQTDISVTVDGAERTKYGLGFPLTYEYTLGGDLTNAASLYVYCKQANQLNYYPIAERTTNDWFQAENAWRQDGNTLYISQGFNTVSTNFTLRITSSPINTSICAIPARMGRGLIQ